MENTKLPKNIQQYIDLVYSEKSELNKIQDLQERKKVACEKAKLDYNSESVQNIVHMKDKNINTAIFDVLVSRNSNEYILLISDQHLFWDIQQRMMKPLEDSNNIEDVMKDLDLKTKISEKSSALLERLSQRYRTIFTQGEELDMGIKKVRMVRLEDRLNKKSV